MDQPRVVPKSAPTHEGIHMEALSLQTILDDSKGALRQGRPGRLIRGLTTDSRLVKPGELFVALRGDRFDGHDFVTQYAQQGADGAIVDRNWKTPVLPDYFALIEVDDTLQAYQRIAAAYRRSLPLKIIAITGSNGKTSTKDFAAAVLSQRFKVVKTAGNLNNHIGVPQTLFSANAGDQIMVLEMGMNHPGEIAPLADMSQPNTAIITNIGSAHIEFMKTREAIAREKGMLAEAVGSEGHVILPVDDVYTAGITRRTSAQVITVGFERGDLRAEDIVEEFEGSRFQMVEGDSRVEVRLPVPGLHMVINALFAAAAGRVHGMALQDCAQGLATAQLTRGRLEFKQIAGLQILDDSYNANPDSMIAALKTLAKMPVKGRRIAVLGRMGELGALSESGHRQVGDTVARECIDYLITVGPEAGLIAENACAKGMSALTVATLNEVADAAQCLDEIARPDDLILIKGSRSAAMENILSELTTRRAASAMHTIP